MMRLIKSFGYAFTGLQKCLLGQANFRIHLVCLVMVISAGFYLQVSATEWMMLVFCSGLVLSMELMNTAVEELCNFVHVSYSPYIKIIKDVAAGAVLLSAIAALTCGLIIFIPKILHFFI